MQVEARHAPAARTRTPAAAAAHSLLYVIPLQPQTGAKMSGQMSGVGAHVPGVPHPVPAQYEPVRHSEFVMQVAAQAPSCATLTPAWLARHALL